MNKDGQKIVEFGTYCKKCEYYEKSESEDPCWDCLESPVNFYSKRPMYYKEKEKEKHVRNNTTKR